MAAAALARAGRGADRRALRRRAGGGDRRRVVERGLHAPATTSLGRWFDAAAGVLDVSRRMAFEGQAAMLLEGLAAAHGAVAADSAASRSTPPDELDLLPLLLRLAD